MASSTHKKRKTSGRTAKSARATKVRSGAHVQQPTEKPKPPRTALFHPLAAELASSMERDASLLARVTADHLSSGDPLIGEAMQLAARAERLWRDLVARSGADGAAPYIGSVSHPLRVLKEEGLRARHRDSLSPDELRFLPSLKASIYAAARPTMGGLPAFKWRRVKDGTFEALRPDSAQALAVSLWGVASDSDSQAIRDLLEFHTNEVFRHRYFTYRPTDIWVRYEVRPAELRKSALPVPSLGVVVGAPDTICVIETETLDRSHQRCPAFASGRCDGSVANSGRGCPLDVDDTEHVFPYKRIKNLLKTGTLEVGRPCPFANDNFHNMRVVFAGASLEPREGTFAVVFCHVGSWSPESAEAVEALKGILWDVYGDRVVGIDLEDVVDDLLGSEDHAAADLGVFLWKRIRALGATQLARLIANALPEPRPTQLKMGPRVRLNLPPRLPRVPHDRRQRELLGSKHEATVSAFVHPESGAEAFVASNKYGMRIRVPLSSKGESLVREALAALAVDSEDRAESVEQAVYRDYAIGSIKRRGVDVTPALDVVRNAGFVEERW